ncbi:MAG: hypothetical protein OQK32_04640, partial [Gammaproteobacteria bacterium]|nr:hypothetical protein [Gammaproteobacteria bacterium]
ATQHTIIVSSADSNYQKSLVEKIQKNLKALDISADIYNTEQAIDISTSEKLIISIGHEASILIDNKEPSNPRLIVFADTNPDTDPVHRSKPHLSMTQPICQQFKLIRLLNSKWKNVSVIMSSPNNLLTKEMNSCAEKHKLTVKNIKLNDYVNIIDALNTSLPQSDVLLALPDNTVYNAKNIKSILLTTYRHRIPVIGFSESFVRAGALAAIHSTTEQMARQITEIIQKFYTDNSIGSDSQFPVYFDVVTNRSVAKSLGITIPDRESLTNKLKSDNHE